VISCSPFANQYIYCTVLYTHWRKAALTRLILDACVGDMCGDKGVDPMVPAGGIEPTA
jgi:hypothetical protein